MCVSDKSKFSGPNVAPVGVPEKDHLHPFCTTRVQRRAEYVKSQNVAMSESCCKVELVHCCPNCLLLVFCHFVIRE